MNKDTRHFQWKKRRRRRRNRLWSLF